MIREKEISIIIKILADRLSASLIYVFGSAARGEMTRESDIDIAFLCNRSPDEYEVFVIAQEMASMLGKEVDLINLDKASTVLQAQVVSMGKAIYCRSREKRLIFEMNVLKEYARLNEERRPVIEKVMERGSVYEK
jgi:predicted nucleotidyltransferase